VLLAGIILCRGEAIPQGVVTSRYARELQHAEKLLSVGDFQGVVDTLLPWPGKMPERPEADHFLGLAYYRLKDFPAAIRHLSAALRKESEGSEAWRQTVEVLGAAYYFHNQWKDAVPLLEKASAWQAGNSDLLYSLAMSYLFMRDAARARETFAKVFGIEADSPEAYLLAADLMRKESLESDAEALVIEARQRWPESSGVALRAGVAAAARGEHAHAAALFREELGRHPREPATWHALAEALVALGQTEEASESLKRAIWLDAGWVPSYILLSRIYMDAGRYDVAEDTLKQALKVVPQSYEASFLLGRLYHKTGRPGLARETLAAAELLR